MANVSYFEAEAQVAGIVVPCLAGGGRLDHKRNYIVPDVVGNNGDINYIQGAQFPMVSINHALLDIAKSGAITQCVLDYSWMSAFVARAANTTTGSLYDVVDLGLSTTHVGGATNGGTTGLFNGVSGELFPNAKCSGFTLSCGGIGQPVNLSVQYACFVAPTGTPPTPPSPLTTAYLARSVTTPYIGTPLTWQNCSFYSGATPIEGITSFNITYTNNLTPDPSMIYGVGQTQYYGGANAGKPAGSFNFTYTVNTNVVGSSVGQAAMNDLNTGEPISVLVAGAINKCRFTLNNLLIENDLDREIGTGRQMRSYSGRLLASDNTSSGMPLILASS